MKLSAHRITFAFVVCASLAFRASGGELEDRASLQSQVVSAFHGNRFTELENVSSDFRTKESRTSSGLWKLSLFYSGINSAVDTSITDERYWANTDSKLSQWAAQYPNSPTAPIAQAAVLIRHAWAYRGNGWASEVAPHNWKPYYAHIEKARQHLLKHKASAAVDPNWYTNMIGIALAEGWDQVRFDDLVNEAVARHPYYYPNYFAAIDYLTPKWHGNKAKIEEFANFSVSKTADREKSGMYARVYWYSAQSQYGSRLFTDSSVVWAKMRKGIDDVLSKYPDQWNINNFAQFACLARDKETTQQLIKLIESPIAKVWTQSQDFASRTQPVSFDTCKKFASQ
jgi:Domain of unknown function (DUF4034)